MRQVLCQCCCFVAFVAFVVAALTLSCLAVNAHIVVIVCSA